MEADHPLSGVPSVSISPQGIFKYILITATLTHKSQTINLNFIRGHSQHQYHADNFAAFVTSLKKHGVQITKKDMDGGHVWGKKGQWKIKLDCPGGGRIQHKYQGKHCFIYGYSKSFGRVDHNIAQKMISQSLGYPLNQITTSQEGY